MEREARIHQQLDHPHVLRVRARPLIDRRPALAFEFVDGRTLRRVQEHGQRSAIAPPLDFALAVGLRLLAALDYAHRQGVAHGALTPSDVLLGWNGEAKVLQWSGGVSRLGESLQSQLAYLAPELARGGQSSPATDVFSASAILLFLLSGVALFARATPRATLQALFELDRLEVERVLPYRFPALAEALRNGLAVDPQDRVLGIAGLRRALSEAVRRSGVDIAETVIADHLRALFPHASPVRSDQERGPVDDAAPGSDPAPSSTSRSRTAGPVRGPLRARDRPPRQARNEAGWPSQPDLDDFVRDVVACNVVAPANQTDPDTIRAVTGERRSWWSSMWPRDGG
jgi:serine/threonine protein kinase